MIDPSLRLRRAIHRNSPLLVSRIISAHPHLLQNPDFTPVSSPTSTLTSPSSAIGLSNTSLHLAAYLNHKEIVKILLQLGHEKDGISLNEEYQTPLMLAAREGHTESVLLLVQDGNAGIERRDLRGRDALMLAAVGGWDTIVQILLTYAPPVPYRSSAYNQQISQYPSNDNNISYDQSESQIRVQYLLNQTDIDGNTALHYAASYGKYAVLQTLLAAGANPGKKNVWSWTPLAYSATYEMEDMFVQTLKDDERRADRERERNERQQQQAQQQQAQQQLQQAQQQLQQSQQSPQHGRNAKLRGGPVRMVTAE